METKELFLPGSRISLRSQKGSTDLTVEEDTFITMEQDGTVHAMSREIFEKYLEANGEPVPDDYCERVEYAPIIKNLGDGSSYVLTEHAKMAMPKDAFRLYMKKLEKSVKLFPQWDDDKYMLGLSGDYLAVSEEDLHNIFIEQGNHFDEKFKKI